MKPYYNKDGIMIYNQNCFDVLSTIEAKSIDLILTDMPYNTTACEWDKQPIDLDNLWELLKPLGKDNVAYVFTASQSFTTKLVMSNLKWFKYEWIWEKTRATGHVHAKNKPMKIHENIVVFSKGVTNHASQSKNRMIYYPQGLKDCNIIIKQSTPSNVVMPDAPGRKKEFKQLKTGYPTTIIKIPSLNNNIHPTQKPVALMEYLIKTYTNERDLVLDPFAGSFTTAVACKNLNRKFIGIEILEKYCKIGVERIKAIQPTLFNNK